MPGSRLHLAELTQPTQELWNVPSLRETCLVPRQQRPLPELNS